MRLFVRAFRTGASLLFLFFCLCGGGFAADISLIWEASSSENIAGYRVYIGKASRSYGAPITIPNQTTYTATGMSAGVYYFAVTAVNALGIESEFSNEISTTIESGPACDYNGDALVNALDLQLGVNVILGLRAAYGGYDLNRDGRVDVLDLQLLGNVVLGLRSCP